MKIKCPRCVAEGLRSRVDVGPTLCMDLGGPQVSYDEDGDRHVVNPDIHRTTLECSEGHIFARIDQQGRTQIVTPDDPNWSGFKGAEEQAGAIKPGDHN